MAYTSESHQARGEHQYRLGQFDAALLEFNKAIEMGDANVFRLLDARCGTYEKLKQVDAALRDARQMIKLASSDPRGYLRAGQILVRTDKCHKAYEIYMRGLSSVPADNPKRKTIEELSQKLSAKMAPKKPPVDPFRMLPTETASLILRQLDFFSVVTCLRVCKEWNRLVSSLSELWHTVDFSRAKRLVPISQVRACVRIANSRCRRVVLKRVNDPNRNLLNLVMITCPELEYLETEIGLNSPERILGVAPRLKTLILSGSDSCGIRDIQNVVSKCPNLERAEFHAVNTGNHMWTTSLERLKVLRLAAVVNPVPYSLNHLRGLFEMAPNIEELYLANWSIAANETHFRDTLRYRSLRAVGLENVELSIELPPLPSSIQDLSIAKCSFPLAWQVSSHPSSTSVPNLKNLRLKSNHKLPLSWLDTIMHSSAGSIERLDLSGFVHIATSDLLYYMTQGWFEKLRELHLAYINVQDDFIAQLVKHAANLEVIDLSHTAVTGIAIKELVLTEKKLRRIILLHCQNVGQDAVAFARAKGVKVDYLFPDKKSRSSTRRLQR